MSHLFVSYSTVDGEQVAHRLAAALLAGPPPYPVWFDKWASHAGLQDWDDEIDDALSECRALLFVMTADSVRAAQCKNEWARALDYKKPVVPLRFDAAAKPPFRLASRQYVDFTGPFDVGLARLRQHLAWLDSPEGVLGELRVRLADDMREMRRPPADRRPGLAADIAELERRIREQQLLMADPDVLLDPVHRGSLAAPAYVQQPVVPIDREGSPGLAHLERPTVPVAPGSSAEPADEEPPEVEMVRWPTISVLLVACVLLSVAGVLTLRSYFIPEEIAVRPVAVAIGRDEAGVVDGSIYIAEPMSHQVRVVRPDGTVLPFAGISGKAGRGDAQGPSRETLLDSPAGVAVGMDGTVYIADTGNDRIRRVKNGFVETVPGTEGISEPFALAVGRNDELYVTDKAKHQVLVVSKDRPPMSVAGNGEGGPAGLNFPHGIAADRRGLYIADRNNQVVREVVYGPNDALLTGGSSPRTFAGTGWDTGPSQDGGQATDAALSLPIAVAASGGEVFIVENGSKRIRKVVGGIIHMVDTGKLTLSSPTAIAVDDRGVIYVADSNRLVRIVGTKAKAIATHEAR